MTASTVPDIEESGETVWSGFRLRGALRAEPPDMERDG
jgi:hypothetical protein